MKLFEIPRWACMPPMIDMIVFSLLAAIRDGKWVWGLGDPGLPAILVTLFYFVDAALCFRASRHGLAQQIAHAERTHASNHIYRTILDSKRLSAMGIGSLSRDRLQASYWKGLAVFMVLLGINKQGDLQSWFGMMAREWVRDAGLYESRRTLQVAFIIAIAVGAFLIALSVACLVRRLNWASRLAAIGLIVQIAFIVIRAASFHKIDLIISVRTYNLAMESIGLSLIAMAAFLAAGRFTH